MANLIAFHIYRTEQINVKGTAYIARFTKRKDGQEYKIHITDEERQLTWSCSFSDETAQDFATLHGESLESKVLELLEAETQRDWPS